MIRWGLILAAVIIAAGAWFDWTYHAIRTEIAELQSRLPSAADLDQKQTDEQREATVTDCRRVESLQSNLVAKLFKSEDVAALAERCRAITSRSDGSPGP